MKRHFDDDLTRFNTSLLEMAAMTEQVIFRSTEALKNRDAGLAREVISSDEAIDDMEIAIDEQAIDLLALYQPMAIDLRFITTGMHINADLERIADLAVNISNRVVDLADQPHLKPLVDIPKLSDVARTMVKKSIDAFVNRNEDLAKEVILSDEKSDLLRNAIVKELIYDYMVKDGTTAPRAVSLLLIARDLERICDHAVSIAQDVIYMIRAVVVKHHPENLDNPEA